MDFVAIDVETANADMASICQVGVASFKGGRLCQEWKTYVDPEDYFDAINVSIHGIDEKTVAGAPCFPDIAAQICQFVDGQVVLCHTHFDRVAVSQVHEKYDLCAPTCTWLDSARVARRAWEQFARGGYGLRNVCSALGYDFNHHDALEDAKAAAHILLAASAKTGLDIAGWLRRVEQPIDPRSGMIAREGNPQGPFAGEVLVFTGALSIPRREAADMASSIGCTVEGGVTKRTTILVVGDQDVMKLAGHEKSSKHRKAECLMRAGQAIRVLRETDFKQLVNCIGDKDGMALRV